MLCLNLGSASKIIPDWVNIDIVDYLTWSTIYAKDRVPEFKKDFVQAEALSYLLGTQSISVDCIAAIHFLDHLKPVAAARLLKQCYRVLAPGGVLRIEVEDFKLILQHWEESRLNEFDKDQPPVYKNAGPDAKLAYIMFGNLAAGQDYTGHKMIYTYESLYNALQMAGFSYTEVTTYGVSKIELWKEEYDTQPDHSLFMEATK